jgi:hypothetical protein
LTETTIRDTGAALISLTAADSQEFSDPWHGRPARELRVDAPHSNCTTSLAEVLDNQEAVAILFGPNVLDWSMMVAHGKFFDASGEK